MSIDYMKSDLKHNLKIVIKTSKKHTRTGTH